MTVNRLKQIVWKWACPGYIGCMMAVMFGYTWYDAYHIDGDAVSYMDISSSIVHGRWREIVNGLWNPGYPALLAVGKILTHADRMHELQVFYWVNYCIFLISIACTWFFVRSVLYVRAVPPFGSFDDWVFSAPLLYLAAYATVLFSWLNEFSPGKILVDGLFASLLLLAFAFLLRSIFSPRLLFDLGMGVSFGLAYLVKSPGLILAVVGFVLAALCATIAKPVEYRRWRLGVSILVFIVVAGPYIAALSIQKQRIDFGDSGKLNYAWYASGTDPQHLLNNQPKRFGDASVHLKHPEVDLLSDPGVLYFPHFPHATYPPWFDPSYANDGIQPHFDFARQIRLTLQQSRRLLFFLSVHALPIVLLIFCFVCGMRVVPRLRWLFWLFFIFLSFSFAMYLGVHFLDRYVAGEFWVVWIVTAGLLITKDSRCTNFAQGAAAFFAIAILVLGFQSMAQQRQTVMLKGLGESWQNPEEFGAARALRANGILPGDSVACFRACNTGTYWARLAGVHVNSEIFDPEYMSADAPDVLHGNAVWQNLPNKEQALSVLQSSGAKALVGYFEYPPREENWKPLAGGVLLYSTVQKSDDRTRPSTE